MKYGFLLICFLTICNQCYAGTGYFCDAAPETDQNPFKTKERIVRVYICVGDVKKGNYGEFVSFGYEEYKSCPDGFLSKDQNYKEPEFGVELMRNFQRDVCTPKKKWWKFWEVSNG